MKTSVITGTVVTLATIPEYLPVLSRPQIGEYSNPWVLKIQPCIKQKNGKYVDLRTGCEVKKSQSTLEWLNLSGTVFRYPDGHNVLISKMLDGSNNFIVKEIVENDINNMMMPRKIFDRTKEKKSS